MMFSFLGCLKFFELCLAGLKFMDSVGAAGGDFFKSGFDIFGFDLVVHKTKNQDDIVPFVHGWAVLLDNADFFFFDGIKQIHKQDDACGDPKKIIFHSGVVRSWICAVHPSGSVRSWELRIHHRRSR